MDCPRCENNRLEPSSLKGYPVHICQPCRGIMMARKEVEALLERAASSNKETQSAPSAVSYFQELKASPGFVGDTPSVVCPACEYSMFESKVQGLIIDFCMNCQSLWFDEGELATAIDKAKTHGELDLVPASHGDNDTVKLISTMLDLLA